MFDYKICQISDTHLTPKNARPANNQRVDPLLKLMQVFDDIYTTRVNPDLIVITGDLIHEGSANDYRDFKTVIDQEERRFNVPIRVILGNHDRTRPFYQGYLQKSYLTRYYYSISNNEWDFYFLDTKCGDLE
ncbi:metallophosphoesterase family protein [Lentilactobacillus parabuchneri]|nr:3',5'-cyclic adenosine monophosphate phosphodiesterase CpdA [Lentilactobacillus parabuchneri]ORN23405.1 3',5'-cyclic adenosine monophosphate phosphodiesterase CpdA [Lentilactobacillus parabuchneri]